MNTHYLESKVLTAPPQQLHLLLIDGAIRFARMAEEPLRRGEAAAAATPLLRALDIVGELLAGVRDNQCRLNEQLAAIYAFIFRRMSAAKINGDTAALADALRLLEFERQTWQLACEKFAGAKPDLGPKPRPSTLLDAPSGDPQGRFSLEA